MNATRHERESELFLAALDLPLERRPAFLAQACGDDTLIRRGIEDLLAQDEEPAALDDSPGRPLRERLERDVAVPALPERIGPYRILGLLGSGGMGTVFRAEQASPRRIVALKVLHAELVTPDVIRRFEFEAAALARLTGPGIAQIYEAGVVRENGRRVPYFAMELIDGCPLTTWAADHRLSIRARLELLAEVCRAVARAHQQGIIHRDLKPANILVDADGRPRVLDFGVARAIDEPAAVGQTRPGQLVGTVAYMSPEQRDGDPARVDTRNDVYALGVLGFELLAGHLPWDLGQRSLSASLTYLRSADAPLLGTCDSRLRGDIETIIARALAPERERRYASAADLAGDIDRYLADEPIAARPASWRYRLGKFARRNRALVGGALAVLLSLTAGLAATTWQATRATHAQHDALRLAERAEQARLVAEDAAARAKTVQRFLQSVLTSATRAGQGGIDYTVREALDDAAGRIETGLAAYPAVRIELHETLGDAYLQLGVLAEARRHLETSVAARRRALGPGHPDLLRGVSLLSQTLGYLGDYQQAALLEAEAYDLAVARFGAESRQAAGRLASLALTRARLGDRAVARDMLAVSLEIGQAGSIEQRIALERQRGNLASLDGDWPAAEAAYRSALDLRNAAGPQRDACRTYLMNRLAKVLESQRRWEDALAMYRTLLPRQIDAVGPVAPRVVVTRAHIARCLLEIGRTAAAVEQIGQVQADLCEAYQADDPGYVAACHLLGRLYRRLDNPVAAERFLREGLARSQRLPPVPDTIRCGRDLATLVARQGRRGEGRMLLEQTIARAADGPLAEHPELEKCRRLLARIPRTAAAR